MPKKLIEYRQKRKQRLFIILALAVLGLLAVAALMHVGAGEAEWAGMSVSNITPALAMEFGIPKDETGVIVNWCEDPAYSANVRGGDLVRAVNNKKVKNVSEFLKVTKTLNLQNGVLLDIARNGQPLYITMENKLGLHDAIKKAFSSDNAVQAAFANRSPAETAETGANGAATSAPGFIPPTPKEQGAAQKELIEGHWLGMELIPLTPELAKEYRVPLNTKGLLVDEVCLEAAEAGLLAGDMVVGVGGIATPDLVRFTEATRKVKNRCSARMLICRRGQLLELTISARRSLGFSQNESAQPITPGALSPHRNRNKPCTTCHIIMVTGGQLPTDAGDILPSPPPITKGAIAPHAYRGKCESCHIILKR